MSAHSKVDLLLALAERCEREWPSFQLDNDIADVIAGEPVHPPFLNFSTSLDAAVTLVPEGWSGRIGLVGWASVLDGACINGFHCRGRTPALALCAAALRARAAGQMPEESR